LSVTDYAIDIALILIVLRQIRTRPLTARSAVIPFVILAIAGSHYLKGFPTKGDDLLMDVVLVVAGAAFGIVSGLTTKVWKDAAGHIVCQAGVTAAAVWILGMAIRMGFDIWANTKSGETSLYHFSMHHSITSAQAYATAFVLMAFAQVLIRVGIMQFRRVSLESSGSPVHNAVPS